MRKRSVTIDGHRTSISLEDAFWAELQAIAEHRGLALNALVAEVDRGRGVDLPQDAATQVRNAGRRDRGCGRHCGRH